MEATRNITRRQSRLEFQSIGELFRPEYGAVGQDAKNEKLWKLMANYKPIDMNSIQTQIVNHVEYTLAKNRFNFGNKHCYAAVAHSLRDRLIETFNDTQQYMHHQDVKRVYYLSLEFLLGRAMQNTLVNLQLEKAYSEALMDLGYQLETLYDEEIDPALGNGGLGRLAACFLDSLATLDLPAWGYGIRYNYGIFRQKIIDGYQVEVPDYWLANGNPWEIERQDVMYPIRFYGHVRKFQDKGKEKSVWEGGEIVVAEAHDNPLPGYNTFNSINLRLWKSIPTNEFDFASFNTGDYFGAIDARQRAEYISSVLYPNDSTMSGKELRLKQQYFFISATLIDVLRRFKKKKRDWKELPQKMAIQLNDTHPALAIVEMLRLLIDIEGLEHEFAFEIIYNVFAYTNHTVLPEALEKWNVGLMGHLLPRHLEIVYLINFFWLQKVQKKYPGNVNKMKSLSIVEEVEPKYIRMANLCIVGSHAVNGVAELHSGLLKTHLFKDFYEMNPKKFQNKTNGVTPRRWIKCCNPFLSAIYEKHLGNNDWVNELEKVKVLKAKAEDKAFQEEWIKMKLECKRRLVKWVKKECGVLIPENSLFDIMVKRLHEYKRQLMNTLYIIHRYLEIKATPAEERKNKFVPRVCMIGGKAAPAYITAKRIIKLVNCIANVVNNDRDVGDYLKVVFLPNYNVSNAEIIIPASDLSQHISTAGLEASGTSNMKFVMNGGLIIGTMDGANVEIAQEVGEENMFIFGALVDEVDKARDKMRSTNPYDYCGPVLNKVFDAILSGMFGSVDELKALIDVIRHNNDHYIVCHDFYSYLEAQERVDKAYRNQKDWTKKSIMNAVLSSKFSSDRTINQYAEEIWNIKPYPVPVPSRSMKERVKSHHKME